MRLLGPAARGLAPPHLLPPAVYHTPRVVVVSSRLDYVSVTRDTSPGRGRRGGLYVLYAGGRVKSARWIEVRWEGVARGPATPTCGAEHASPPGGSGVGDWTPSPSSPHPSTPPERKDGRRSPSPLGTHIPPSCRARTFRPPIAPVERPLQRLARG